MADIKWDLTATDAVLVKLIVKRAVTLGILLPKNRLNTRMDITACHLNGTPLDLEGLLTSDDRTFMADVTEIDEHINRTTGQMNPGARIFNRAAETSCG